MRSRQKQGSLLGILDPTCTAMGARTLRGFIEQPLAIRAKLTSVWRQCRRCATPDMTVDMIREELTWV